MLQGFRITVIILILALVSCQKKDESFQEFYIKFHRDTTFQMERIVFPLEGIPPYVEVIDSSFRWTVEEWQYHVVIPKAKLYNVGKDLVVENTVMDINYMMQRRFARFNGYWYLIYYAGLNEINNESKD